MKRATNQPGKKNVIPVCRATFLGILQISKDRVGLACKRHLDTGLPPSDKRGGDTRSKHYETKRAAMKNLIEKFNVVSEFHYCRGQIKGRQYLSSDLNISKLWRSYNKSVPADLRVKSAYFRRYLCTNYNIGFGSPATDVCSKCLLLKAKLKRCKVPDEKINIMTDMRVHKLRAQAFYDVLRKQNNNELILSFDCQKNLPLPKLPDQSAYYSRQLYMYNFTICVGSSHDRQTTGNTFMYKWLESSRPKGSNEIASSVYDRLNHLDLTDVNKIYLVSDGCGGQNKNSTMIGMVSHWLHNDSPQHIKEVEMVFPVVGHSFIPPDRVFGRIEKEIKVRDTIVKPEDYTKVFERFGTVSTLGVDCPVYDWKMAVQSSFKVPRLWHFKIQSCKRIIVKKGKSTILLRGEQCYRSDFTEFRSVTKKGKTVTFNKIQLPINCIKLKSEKLRDVERLLKNHYGEDWQDNEELQYYTFLMNEDNGTEEEEAVDTLICEPRDEDDDLRI